MLRQALGLSSEDAQQVLQSGNYSTAAVQRFVKPEPASPGLKLEELQVQQARLLLEANMSKMLADFKKAANPTPGTVAALPARHKSLAETSPQRCLTTNSRLWPKIVS